MVEFADLNKRNTLDGSELVLGAGASTQTVAEKWDMNAINAWNGFVNPVGYGADPTGATDCTAQVKAAADAASGAGLALIFPPGTYTINGSVYLNPKHKHDIRGNGNVRIETDMTRGEGVFSFQGLQNMESEIRITAMANINWPSNSTSQREHTRLTGDFSGAGLKHGDLVCLASDARDHWDAHHSEWFFVMDASSTEVICNKKMYHTYNPSANQTWIKKMSNDAGRMKIRDLTFVQTGDGTGGERAIQSYAGHMHEIDVKVENTYHASISLYGDVGSKVKIELTGGYVDYSQDHYNYGVVCYGNCYMTEMSGYGENTGHLCDCTPDPRGNAFDISRIGRIGTPMNIIYSNIRSIAHARAAVKSHGSFEPIFMNMIGMHGSLTTTERYNNDYTLDLAAVDPIIEGLYDRSERGPSLIADIEADSTLRYRNVHHKTANLGNQFHTVITQTGTISEDTEDYDPIP